MEISFGLFRWCCFYCCDDIAAPPKDKSDWVAALLFLIGVLVGAIVSFWKTWTDSTDQVVFYNRFNGAGMLGFLNNKPNRETLDSFVEQIKKYVPPIVIGGPEKDKTIAYEISELAKLRDNKVLTEQEFQAAKASLLKKLDVNRVGF
ncbi:MAG: SHOCT domain-containing protein [Candidatus Omnitrophica bacterium]|nr:SHOCT domain-containing protein [Candidatus Omnitrophota bacterium]